MHSSRTFHHRDPFQKLICQARPHNVRSPTSCLFCQDLSLSHRRCIRCRISRRDVSVSCDTLEEGRSFLRAPEKALRISPLCPPVAQSSKKDLVRLCPRTTSRILDTSACKCTDNNRHKEHDTRREREDGSLLSD